LAGPLVLTGSDGAFRFRLSAYGWVRERALFFSDPQPQQQQQMMMKDERVPDYFYEIPL
jgi:hypothetical protein